MIVGIGWSKTGTHSLVAALRMLGLRATHLGEDIVERQTVEENAAAGRPLLAGLEQYDGVADWPVPGLFRAIAEQYPDARFVLTYRPPDDVAWSWVRQLHAQPEIIGPGWETRLEDVVRDVSAHVSDVLAHFRGQGDRLLLLDQRDSSQLKWSLLAQFAGVAQVPAAPFPHEFSFREWRETGLQ